jgi:LysM repeat protein
MSSSENIQPEYYPASDVTNGLGEPQIRSGSDAQQYFSFFATHVGGVYQTVSGVTPGAMLRFSVYAHLWSSTFDEATVSEEDGSMVLQVGIDPTGGTDGASASIVWSIAGQTYDAYAEYSVSAAAQAASVTVFVRSSVSFPVKNNVVYLDDAALVVEGGATEVPPTDVVATEVPPTDVVATEVPPTDIPPTDVVATDIPPTEVPTLVPPTDVPPTEVPTLVPPTDVVATTVVPTVVVATATQVQPTQVVATIIPTTPAPTNTLAPSPTLNRTQFPLQIIYQVSTGDTVGAIAARYGSTIQAIIIANGLNGNALIFPGQQLIIPLSRIPTATTTATATSVRPTATLVPATRTPSATATMFTGQMILYIVQPGDALSTIALRFGTTVRAIAQANNILNLQLVFAGQRLNIPSRGVVQPPRPTATATRTATLRPASTATTPPRPTPTIPVVNGGIRYIVQPGDNLYLIAIRYRVTITALVQANQLANPNRIFVGQPLIIP